MNDISKLTKCKIEKHMFLADTMSSFALFQGNVSNKFKHCKCKYISCVPEKAGPLNY